MLSPAPQADVDDALREVVEFGVGKLSNAFGVMIRSSASADELKIAQAFKPGLPINIKNESPLKRATDFGVR